MSEHPRWCRCWGRGVLLEIRMDVPRSYWNQPADRPRVEPPVTRRLVPCPERA